MEKRKISDFSLAIPFLSTKFPTCAVPMFVIIFTLGFAILANLFISPWTWHRYNSYLEEELIAEAIQGILGHHDFSAFQRSGSNRKNAFTTIQDVQIERRGDLLVFENLIRDFKLLPVPDINTAVLVLL